MKIACPHCAGMIDLEVEKQANQLVAKKVEVQAPPEKPPEAVPDPGGETAIHDLVNQGNATDAATEKSKE